MANYRLEALLGTEWYNKLRNEFKQLYLIILAQTIKEQREKDVKVLPSEENVFKAFKLTPYSNVKAVIIGQDPYPTDHADGLAFSSGIAHSLPYSLKQILNAIERDIFNGLEINLCVGWDYNLNLWAAQGLLLLNSRLTVVKGRIGSHKRLGWETFMKKVVMELNNHEDDLMFVLLGGAAKQFKPLIGDRHKIVVANHPASARHSIGGWNDNGCFKQLDEFFKSNNINFKWYKNEKSN